MDIMNQLVNVQHNQVNWQNVLSKNRVDKKSHIDISILK